MKIPKISSLFKKNEDINIKFDPETQYAVIRSSICTGEKVAGFKNKEDGKFIEVMLLREAADLDKFMKIYKITEVKKEY